MKVPLVCGWPTLVTLNWRMQLDLDHPRISLVSAVETGSGNAYPTYPPIDGEFILRMCFERMPPMPMSLNKKGPGGMRSCLPPCRPAFPLKAECY